MLPNNLNFDVAGLKPLKSVQAVKVQLDVYKNYVQCFENGVGDIAFNKAGAHLNKLYFENIREVRADNQPLGQIANVLEMRYGSWDNFVKTYLDTVERLQGSGWVFMNTSGYMNIIPNNRIVDHVGFVICFWEHSYLLDWGTDREGYAREHLKAINWDVVNKRILEKRLTKDPKGGTIDVY